MPPRYIRIGNRTAKTHACFHPKGVGASGGLVRRDGNWPTSSTLPNFLTAIFSVITWVVARLTLAVLRCSARGDARVGARAGAEAPAGAMAGGAAEGGGRGRGRGRVLRP